MIIDAEIMSQPVTGKYKEELSLWRNKMHNILEEISDSKLKETIKGIIITHENMDEAFERYKHGFLDTFNHCLSEAEADNLLKSFIFKEKP